MPVGYIEHGFMLTDSASGTVMSRIQATYPTGGWASTSFDYGVVTSTQPIDEEPVAKSGYVAQTYSNDLYYRMHVIPAYIDVGNLLSSQVRNIVLWNSHFTNTEVSSVTTTAVDGVTLTEPAAAPYSMQPLGIVTYQLSIDSAGPPVIEAAYSFTFDTGESHVLPVTGKRVVVWPYSPQHGSIESLEWKTDVIRTKSSEQRHALRKTPRQSLEFTYWLDEKQYSRAKAMSYGWGQRVFGVPVWTEATFIGTVPEGTSTVNFDTTNTDYRVNEVALLWASDTDFQACEIQSLTSSSITFKLPTSRSMTGAYIAPTRYGRAVSGMSATRDANKRVIADVTFEVTANQDFAASVSLPTYEGIEVMTDLMYKVGTFEDKVLRETNVVDNGISLPFMDAKYSTPSQWSTVSWVCSTRAQLWRLRKWIHSRKGKWKSFWLPSRQQDLTIVGDVTPSATSITVENLGYSLYYASRSICIRLKNGTRYFNTVTSGTANTDGTETLFLQTPFDSSVSFTTAEVDYVCLMNKVRLDTDRIEIRHDLNNTTVSVPTIEVPV